MVKTKILPSEMQWGRSRKWLERKKKGARLHFCIYIPPQQMISKQEYQWHLLLFVFQSWSEILSPHQALCAAACDALRPPELFPAAGLQHTHTHPEHTVTHTFHMIVFHRHGADWWRNSFLCHTSTAAFCLHCHQLITAELAQGNHWSLSK